MDFLQRAGKNVLRNVWKTVLYGLAFFLIGNMVLTGIGIRQAGNQAQKLTREKMKPAVSYGIDYSIMSADYKKGIETNFTMDFNAAIRDMEQDERVVAVNHFIELLGYSYNYEAYWLTDSHSTTGQDTILRGNETALPLDLAQGYFEITSGRFYNEEDLLHHNRVAVINDLLAESADLRLGDFIEIALISPLKDAKSFSELGEDACIMSLEIIGIYHNNELEVSADDFYRHAMSLFPNIVMVPGSTLAEYEAVITDYTWDCFFKENPQDAATMTEEELNRRVSPESLYEDKAVFLLNDPLNIEQFTIDYTQYTNRYVVFKSDNTTYDSLSKPMQTIVYFADLILKITVIASILIIGVVTALVLKNREFEIGVQIASGVRKFRIIAQLFTELLLIMTFAFILSFFTGTVLVNKIGYQVLAYQTNENEEFVSADSIGEKYFTDITMEDMVNAYHIEITPLNYVELYLLGVLLVLTSLTVPALMVMRSNPKKIMSRIG